MLPTLFISHGSPTMAVEDSPARRHLVSLGKRLPSPKYIIVLSAHHMAQSVEVGSAQNFHTVHDFGGFSRALYQIRYDAAGAPDKARDVLAQLERFGFPAFGAPSRGLDHGAWVPLRLMFPNADVPIVPVSIDPTRSSQWHLKLGHALSALRDDGALIIGSGSMTHNLRAMMRAQLPANARPLDWVQEFADWFSASLENGLVDEVVDFQNTAPFARENHPTTEHLLPLFVALGAAGSGASAKRIHRSATYGVLSMDCYAFGAEAEIATTAGENLLAQPVS